MTARYVVSIAGELLYFDADRQPAPEFQRDASNTQNKPGLKLIPPDEKPAADSQWDEALARFTPEQRNQAEISELIDQ